MERGPGGEAYPSPNRRAKYCPGVVVVEVGADGTVVGGAAGGWRNWDAVATI
jgi:hypothetical protein